MKVPRGILFSIVHIISHESTISNFLNHNVDVTTHNKVNITDIRNIVHTLITINNILCHPHELVTHFISTYIIHVPYQ
jgi:hypothetical protein